MQVNESTGHSDGVEALSERIARLTELVAARGDETSRKLRHHLDLLSRALAESTSSLDAFPPLVPAGEEEMVLGIPPKLDIIEAILTGRRLGRGETDSRLAWPRPTSTSYAEDLEIGRRDGSPKDPEADGAHPLAGPDTSEFEGDDIGAADEFGPGSHAVDPAMAPAEDGDQSSLNSVLARVVAEAEDMEVADAVFDPEMALAELVRSEDDDEGMEAIQPPLHPPPRSDEVEDAAPDDWKPVSLAEPEVTFSEDIEIPEGEPTIADGFERILDGPPTDAHPEEEDSVAAVQDSADLEMVDPPGTVQPTADVFDAPHVGLAEEDSDSSPSSNGERGVDTEVVRVASRIDPETAFFARIDEASALSIPPEGETPWGQSVPGDVGPLGPTAEEVVRSLDSGDVAVPLESKDVLSISDDDELAEARREANHVLASLRSAPEASDDVPSEPVEPLERLATCSVLPRRPQPEAVSCLPRKLAYEAMAAPLRLDEEGTLLCLVSREYEPGRIQRLARVLGRKVSVMEVDHQEVIKTFEMAYGPVAGSDQDALLISISSESFHAPEGLFGRMTRWFKNT